jgi:hypothetical protein
MILLAKVFIKFLSEKIYIITFSIGYGLLEMIILHSNMQGEDAIESRGHHLLYERKGRYLIH